MQKMMQQMQKMQSCMQNIDQAKLNAIDQQSSQIRAKVESLCAKGKRDEAQETAMSFGKEMAKDPTMQEMRKCSEMMSGEMMQGMMPKTPLMDLDNDLTSRHVCDQYESISNIDTFLGSVNSHSGSSTTIKIKNVILMRVILQYAFAVIALTIYGGQV